MDTSLKNGLTLIPQEYVIVKYLQGKFERSSVIISEFTGCSRHLNGALQINPYDEFDIAKKIDEALNLSIVEKTQRMEQTFEYIQRMSTLQWAHNFLMDLKRSYDPVGSYVKTGFGLNWQLIKSKKGFKTLDLNLLEDVYKNCNHRIFIIDLEGVVPMKSTAQGKHEPTAEAIEVLNQLSNEPKNIVFVVSDESKKQMYNWFHKDAPRLGLAAEGGFFYRWTAAGGGENEWGTLLDLEEFQWKN